MHTKYLATKPNHCNKP